MSKSERCGTCGYPSSEHLLAHFYASGTLIGADVLVCPTGAFSAKSLKHLPPSGETPAQAQISSLPWEPWHEAIAKGAKL